MVWQDKPFAIRVKAGQVVAICQCGKTQSPPFCDGRHAGSPYRPLIEKIERDGTIHICGCGKSNKLPYCDGSHNTK